MQSFNESGMYVNVLELFDDAKINSINFWKNVNNVIFILSTILVVGLIWLGRTSNPYILMALMFANILTLYAFFEIGITTKGILYIFPILGIVTVILSRLMARDRLAFNKYDFSQSLGGAILLALLGIIVYVVPNTF